MPDERYPPVRQMVREAVEELGSPTTNVAVRDWIREHYPGTNRGTVDAQRLICTVNQPSRVHYTENRRPRVADDPRYDFLFRPARGRLEWYRPERHGVWSIEQDDEGTFAICCDDGELIYPQRKARMGIRPPERRRTAAAPVPITQAQIDAANRLHHKLPQWAASDRAFEQAAERFPHWDRESCVLKAAAINDLYSTRVYAIWRMAEHLMHVMADPPGDAGDLAAAIASLPGAEGGQVERRHWSFASKILHFFVDGDRFPIYDSYCRDMLAHHLGRGGRVSDPANPYRAFMANLGRLRDLSGLTASLRDLDRYLWLAGQYRDWLRKGEDARTNSELRSLFEHPSPQEQTDLATLLRT
jgi:hypothetical protein